MNNEFIELKNYAKRQQVLYVEDSDVMREETSAFLSSFYSKVDTAGNGAKGLENYKKNRYDIVISDIKMPVMDGIKMVKQIKGINKQQPIIIVSAHDDSKYLIDLISIGIDRFILKPISSESFMDALIQISKRIMNTEELLQSRLHEVRLSAMNNILQNIAHRWRQPLNALGALIQELKDAHEFKELDDDHFNKLTIYSMDKINEMSDMINLFKELSVPRKSEKATFNAESLIGKLKEIIEDNLINKGVELKVEIEQDIRITSYQNLIVEVLTEIIKNSLEAILQKKPNLSFIKLKISNDKENVLISITNNGGQIHNSILNRIFDPYSTTKFPKFNEGLGLFLAKTTVENSLFGEINVVNIKEGVEFKLKLKREI